MQGRIAGTRKGNFNPHSPCGERPGVLTGGMVIAYFNPHSPCGERRQSPSAATSSRNFNPHSPCGERLFTPPILPEVTIFQSTLPLRGATSPCSLPFAATWEFQSTLPLRGATQQRIARSVQHRYFNPHSPCGERPLTRPTAACSYVISIHTPLAGSDLRTYNSCNFQYVFQSTLPLRGATG